ncbi:hypothetical protein ACE0DR_24905 [Azotobacter sp. CWF10]
MLSIAWLAAAGTLLSLSFLLKVSETYSRLWFVSLLLIGWSTCLLLRFCVFLVLRRLHASGRNLKTVLLVESGGEGAERLSSGRALEEYGFKVVHSLPFRHDESWLESLAVEVSAHAVHEVWLCLPMSEGAPSVRSSMRCATTRRRCASFPNGAISACSITGSAISPVSTPWT